MLAYLDHPLDVAMTLGKVDGTQRGLALPVAGVGLEHGPSTLPLRTNHSAHSESATKDRSLFFNTQSVASVLNLPQKIDNWFLTPSQSHRS